MKFKLIILLLISLINTSYSSIKFELVANPRDSGNLILFLQEIFLKLMPDYEIICEDIYTTATPWFLDNKLKNCFIIAKEDIKTSSKIGGNKQKTWFICPKKASVKYNSKDQ